MSKMKNTFVVLFFLSFAICFGQNNTATKENAKLINENAKDSIQVKPEPVEGFLKFYQNLRNSIRVPENKVSGTYRTLVSFIVDKDGTLTDYKIIKETPNSIGLGEEVIRVLKTFPQWKPSSNRTPFMLPVTTVVENEPEPEPAPKKD